MPGISGPPLEPQAPAGLVGPCELWPMELRCRIPDDITADDIITAKAATTEVLWNLSGRRYGMCTVPVRPCRRGCHGFGGWEPGPQGLGLSPWGGGNGGWWYGSVASGWGVVTGCRCSDLPCSCGPVEQLDLLEAGKVARIKEVMIDGVVLDRSAYRLDGGRYLYRIDGQQWPQCNDFASPVTTPGVWQLLIQRGKMVPRTGQLAAGELCCELIKLMANDTDCALPKRVKEIRKQGVDMMLIDPMEFLEKGRTGLYLTDLFLTAVNPKGRRGRGARLVSADVPSRLR